MRVVYRDAVPPFTLSAFFTAFPPPCFDTLVCLPGLLEGMVAGHVSRAVLLGAGRHRRAALGCGLGVQRRAACV